MAGRNGEPKSVSINSPIEAINFFAAIDERKIDCSRSEAFSMSFSMLTIIIVT